MEKARPSLNHRYSNLHGLQFLDIPELDFCGRIKLSQNEEFAVGFADSCRTDGGMRGGFRESGDGVVLLIGNGNILWSHKVERPAQACVSDNGDVAVCDWGFGGGLKSTLLLVGPDGEVRLKKKIQANLLSCAITSDGQYAFFNSCASDVDGDSCKLFAFLAQSGTPLFIVNFPIQTVEAARRDANEIIVTSEGLDYRFSLDGTLTNALHIDASRFDKALAAGEYSTAYYILKRRRDAAPPSTEVRTFMTDGYSRLAASATADYRAKSLRDWGLLLLEAGEKVAAAERFRQALALNPNIGLKRKLAELEKEIAGLSTR